MMCVCVCVCVYKVSYIPVNERANGFSGKTLRDGTGKCKTHVANCLCITIVV